MHTSLIVVDDFLGPQDAWSLREAALRLTYPDLRGPFPAIKIVPTGGVTIENAADWIRAGALAVGAGSALVDPKAVQSGRFDLITGNAQAFAAAVRGAR